MKVLSVGDCHGSENPLKIAKKYQNIVDKIIFHGDYVDSYTEDNNWPEQKEVLEKILEFKSKNESKVELLIGNHDIQYIGGTVASRRQFKYEDQIRDFFFDNLDKFDVVSVIDDYIFSHAGVSLDWLNENQLKLDQINKVFHNKNWGPFKFVGPNPSGDNKNESPMWIRPSSLMTSQIPGFNQVVGHTMVNYDEYFGLRANVFSIRDLMHMNNGRIDNKRWDELADLVDNKIIIIDSMERDVYSLVETTNKLDYRLAKGIE